jgi:hypothetical protein
MHVYHKAVPNAGPENPGFVHNHMDQATSITHAVRPATGTDTVAICITGVVDETATAELTGGSAPVIAAANEIQTVVSNETAGTLVLTYSGQTTAAIAWNATAAAVQSALEGLSNIGVGDVSATGGDLDQSAVEIEFTGALAATDVVLITSIDDVVISQAVRGRSSEAFALEGSINIPPGDSTYGPQVHVWSLNVADYAAEDVLDVIVADHDTLHSWTAILLIGQGLDLANVLDFGTDNFGDDTVAVATFGPAAVPVKGSKVIPIVAKGHSGHYLGAPTTVAVPFRYRALARAASDAMTLDTWLSAPVGITENIGSVGWAGPEHWASGALVLRPAVAAGGTTLSAALDAEEVSQWVEIAHSAGTMNTTVEVDLGSLPDDAVLVSAYIEFTHTSDVANRVRAVLVGIDGTDTTEAVEQQIGYTANPGQVHTVRTNAWTALADGSQLHEWARLGITFKSTTRHPLVTTHKIYWARMVIEYEPGGPSVASITPPVLQGDPVSWVYSSGAGLPQTHYQLMLIAGAVGDPETAAAAANPLNAGAGEIIYDSGRTAGAAVSSEDFEDIAIARGDTTYGVRVWTRLRSGVLFASEWATAVADVGTPATPTPAQGIDPVFNPATGGVDCTVTSGIGDIRAWLLRSEDSGATYQITPGSPFAVLASTPGQVISDFYAPLAVTGLRYQVTFDDGAARPTNIPLQVGADADTATPTTEWYAIVPDQPALNVVLDVADQTGPTAPHSTTISEQPGAAVIMTSDPLATRLSLRLRTMSPGDRVALRALFESGRAIRIVDIFGRSWLMRSVEGIGGRIISGAAGAGIRPTASETTGIRDAHIWTVDLIEVAS